MPPAPDDPFADVPTRDHDAVLPVPPAPAGPGATVTHAGILPLPVRPGQAPRATREHTAVLTLPVAPPLSSTDAGAPAPAATPGPPPAGRYGPYEVVGELARGGMGVVYRARHHALGTEVALKVLLAGGAGSAEERLRFQHEAKVTAALAHPGIVAVRDYGVEGGAPWLAMDLVRGESLRARVARDGPLEPREAARLAAAVARALAHAHAQGVLHRDLKPHNVLVDEGGAPRLTDFGLARRVDAAATAGLTVTGQILGTPAYMAPEQARAEGLDVRADVYGLGATLYELLVGRPPFQGVTVLHVLTALLTQEPVPPARLRPGLDRDLETIVLCCLEKAPGRRYASAEALAEDLERFLDGRPVRARPLTPARRAGRAAWRRRRALAWSAVGLTALAALPAWRARETSEAAHREAVRDAAAQLPTPAPETDVERAEALAAIVRAHHAADPRFAPLLVQRAHQRLVRLDHVGAVEDLDLALRARPDDGRALAVRGLARAQLGRMGAAEDAAAALAAGPCPLDVILELVQLLGRVQRLDDARRVAEAATRAAPEARDAWLARSVVAKVSGDLDAALAAATRAAALDPRTTCLMQLAELRLLRAEPRAALPILDQVLAVEPDHAAALVGRAGARLTVGDAAGAEADASRAIDLGQRTASVLLTRAEARARRGDRRGAAGDLRLARDLEPANPFLAARLAMLELELGNTDGALQAARAAAGLEPESLEAQTMLVTALLERGELDAAATTAEAVALHRPTEPAPARLQAEVALARGDVEAALRAARRAVALGPGDGPAHWTLGRSLARAGDLVGAVGALESAVTFRGDDAIVLATLAMVQFQRGERAAARAAADRAVARASTWNVRGSIRAGAGDPAGAIDDFSEALRRDPRLTVARANRATARAELAHARGEPALWAAAAADAEAALAADPSRATCRLVLGQAHAALGDLPAAEAELGRAAAALPGDPSAWVVRGEVRLRRGDRAGARADAEQAAALAPAGPWAARLASLRAALAAP